MIFLKSFWDSPYYYFYHDFYGIRLLHEHDQIYDDDLGAFFAVPPYRYSSILSCAWLQDYQYYPITVLPPI
ncbi:MAG: hypothetical protein PWP51_2722 [Clostridiales bacterium]|nr:hypothetical protein [Clostridiales bacterium]